MNHNFKDYSELKGYLVKAQQTGLNVGDLLRQLEDAIESAQSPTIKIVLLGSFSDGKTTTIAGVLGREEDNMKIDQDESSNELTFYHLPALGKEFEIVDTPGMFGTKEREMDGEIVKYSDITRKYIANAHIVLYITNAVNPLKESHSDALKFVLRDLGKLPNTIFVLNKMDSTGCTLSDPDDYNRMAKIKRNTFIEGLRRIINLAPEEERNLKVACIAADPNGRGLKKWLSKEDIYLERSRITTLRSEIEHVANSLDKNSANANVNLSVIKDIILNFLKSFMRFQKDNKNPMELLEDKYDEMRNKYIRLRSDALLKKGHLQQELQNLQFEIENAITNASIQDFSSVVNRHLGDNGARLERTINQIFSFYADQNKANFEKSHIQNDFEKSSELFNQTLKWGGGILKNAKFSADTIKSLRDFIAPAFKFKPWQAVKWASNLTKVNGPNSALQQFNP